MVNPGSFSPLRKAFLLQQKPAYHAAVVGGYAADCVADIQRRYLKCFPIELPHDEEPSAEHLAQVDDNAADPEPVSPDPDDLEDDEYLSALKKFLEVQALVVFRKAQIRRWMAYQYHKDCDIAARDSGVQEAYEFLLGKISGKGVKKPSRRAAMNLWKESAENKKIWEAEVRRRVGEGMSSKQLASIRIKALSHVFNALTAEEKRDWANLAEEEHRLAVEAFEQRMKNPFPSDPASRQNCIEGLIKLITPVLDLIRDATGWKVSLLAGGPEPADGGRLNIISIHSGSISGNVKMNFGRAERESYKNTIVPLFGRFLKKCYTVEECW
ncbi:hypothetical protein Hypma_009709 [Hypsizygus marmoreus]|uniref:Uncharacterized protein n=1 Tax=Hypsizygus marmoreus TaxID=39966 RepID=A0A369JMZ2_HYPMA|nr:hypothetical protein Hypma_009709 [Hypsizygus marmoreus]